MCLPFEGYWLMVLLMCSVYFIVPGNAIANAKVTVHMIMDILRIRQRRVKKPAAPPPPTTAGGKEAGSDGRSGEIF